MNRSLSTKEIAYMGLITALLIISSWISVPLVIPFTLQIMAVAYSILHFRNLKSLIPLVVYIALGAMGLPVFSGFKGGIGVIMGPTGGFIFGFLLMCFGGSLFIGRAESFAKKLIVLFISLLLCYASGLIWYVLVYTKESSPLAWKTAFLVCVLPFIIPDIINLLLAIFLDYRVRKHR